MRRLVVFAALLLAATPSLIRAVSSQGVRVLVLHDDVAAKGDYAQLWAMLDRRGYVLTHQVVTDKGLRLDAHGEKLYDHLLHMAPRTKKYGNEVKVADLLRFVQHGGSLLMAASPDIAEPTRDLAAQFGVEFDYPDTHVTDHFEFDRTVGADDGSHTRIVVQPSQLSASASAIVGSISAPVVFSGLGHATTLNPLTMRVLSAGKHAYSMEKVVSLEGKVKPLDEDPVISGNDIGLVSCAQTLNNVRACFVGSLAMFTDAFIQAPLELAPSDGTTSKLGKNANLELLEQLVQWTFQEKAVVRLEAVRHFHAATGQTPSFYRVKDEITYEIDLAEHKPDGTWAPFAPEDVQLEFTMLDPHLRLHLKPEKSGGSATTLRGTFTAPDVHGMFSFRVNYKRHGLSFLVAEDVVSVRPFRHDEFPRFIGAAYPYYWSAASMLMAFVVFSTVWMWDRAPTQSAQTK